MAISASSVASTFGISQAQASKALAIGSGAPAPSPAPAQPQQGGDYTVTGNPQIDAINRARASAVGQGTNPVSATSSMPRPEVSPVIDAGNLGTGYVSQFIQPQPQDHNAFANGVVPASYSAPNPERDGTLSAFRDALSKISGEGDRYTQLQDQYGISDKMRQLQDLNLTIAQKKSAYDAMYNRAENSAVPTPFIIGEQNQIQKTSAIELGALSALAQAEQGNLTLANDLIDKTIQHEYQPIKDTMAALSSYYQMNQNDLSEREKTQITQQYDLAKSQYEQGAQAKSATYKAIAESPMLSMSQKAALVKEAAAAQSPDEIYSVMAKVPASDSLAALPFGSTLYDKRTGAIVGGRGGTDLISTAMAEGRLTPDQITRFGAQYIAATLQKDPGYDFVSQRASVASNSASLKTAQTQYDSIKANLNTADTNFKLLVDTAQKAGINDQDSPIINQLQNAIKSKVIGNGDLNKFQAGINTLRTEYAQVLARGGEVTEGTRNQAKALIPDDISLKNLQGVYNYIKTEGQNVLAERQSVIDDIHSRIRGSGSSSGGSTSNSPASDPLGLFK